MTKEKESLAGIIMDYVGVIGLCGLSVWGGYKIVKNFQAFESQEQVEFTATFNLPAGDVVGSDEFEVRRRIVNNSLHSWALALDKDEKDLITAKNAIFNGTGSNYQQDLETVKLRRATVDQTEAQLKSDEDRLEHEIHLARMSGYRDIEDISAAVAYKSDSTDQTGISETLAWVGFILATFLSYLGLSILGF